MSINREVDELTQSLSINREVDELTQSLEKWGHLDINKVFYTPVAWHLFKLLSKAGQEAVLYALGCDELVVHVYHIEVHAHDEFVALGLINDPVLMAHRSEAAYVAASALSIRHSLVYLPYEGTYLYSGTESAKWWTRGGYLMYKGVSYPYHLNLEMMETVTSIRDNVTCREIVNEGAARAFDNNIGKMMLDGEFAAEYYKNRVAELQSMMASIDSAMNNE